MRRRKAQPWYDDLVWRLRFERDARRAIGDLRCERRGRRMCDDVVYRAQLDVPEYPITRSVMVALRNGPRPTVARIGADGPTHSPHRYRGGWLCIEYPGDPLEWRWTAGDGLLELLDQIRLHLFKEEYFRETGRWPGPEAPHTPPEPPMPTKADRRRAKRHANR